MGYNTSVHEATGYTPFELTFGRKANLPSTIATTSPLSQDKLIQMWKERYQRYLTNARSNILKSKEKNRATQERRIIKTQTIFQVNDKVLVSNDHKTDKLAPNWLGPAKILEVNTPNYLIQYFDTNRIVTVHGNRLKLFLH